MAVSIIGPKFYAWDSDTGKPLAFGKVYTYRAGTNSPKATFTTEGGETENSNPVILNGAGYADIYLNGSYKIVVKDADDVEVWTADPVSDPSQLQQEWVRQRTITQINGTTFTVDGELTGEFVEGVAVRVKQDSGFLIGNVKSATYADGKTTVTINPINEETLTASAIYVERALVSFESLPKNLSDLPIYLGSIDALEDREGAVDGQQADVLTSNGWIHVYWDAASTITADSVDAFQVTGVTTGRWIRRNAMVKKQTGELEEVQKFVNEIRDSGVKGSDLLSKLMATASPEGMYFLSRGTSGCSVGIPMGKDFNMVLEYRFTFDGDNLLLLRGVVVGKRKSQSITRVEPTLTGTYNTTSAPTSYTTAVGDSFSFSFTGSQFTFLRFCESRGGMWEFVVSRSGLEIARVRQTCYRASNGTVKTQVVNNLPFGDYDVVATFIGEDPNNPPSSAPARGYLYYDSAASNWPVDYGELPTVDGGVDVLTQNTVSDFAIKAKPDGAAYGTEWVPNHSTVTGVATNISQKIIVDGDTVQAGEYTYTTTGSAPSLFYKKIKSFQIIQRFSAENPNGADGAMWLHNITHSMNDRDYTLKISQKITLSQNTKVDVGYWAMLGAESSPANMHRMVLNNGFVKEPIPVPGTTDTFGLDVTQAAYLGEFEAGNYYGICLDAGTLKEAVSLGTEYEVDQPGICQYRDTGIAKTYWTFCEGVTLPAGLVLTHEGTYGAVCGVRSPNIQIGTVG